jgi:Mrp family chromosome partitioning ATPase
MTVAPRKRVALHPASATAGRNVINIASGKGGVGKTWMAISLAHTLARQGGENPAVRCEFWPGQYRRPVGVERGQGSGRRCCRPGQYEPRRNAL